MKVKAGVHFNLFHTSMISVFIAVEVVWWRLRLGEPELTSGTDGEHMEGSKHYIGAAADFGNHFPDWTRHSPGMRIRAVEMLKAELGSDYDVIPEPDHYHIEYDPKG